VSRRRPDLIDIDTSSWPAVDVSALSLPQRKSFARHQRAIDLFASGTPVREIERRCALNRRRLYRLLARCLSDHDDGRVYGYRGLLKHLRTNGYSRTARIDTRLLGSPGGSVGAFGQLLERYPPLAEWLRRQVEQSRVKLKQVRTERGLKTRAQGLTILHGAFIRECKSLGFTPADYPLNTERRAILPTPCVVH
jgi:putative transposase